MGRGQSRLSSNEPNEQSSITGEQDEGIAYMIVAAIDFGTACSGYAFSFKGNHDRVCMNKNWGAGSHASYKTPTSLLVGPNDKLVDFGYEAEKRYRVSDNPGGGFHLFKHFKMALAKNVTRTTKIEALDGYKLPAIDVFALALEYLKGHVLRTIHEQIENKLKPEDIRWVITVPAIWSDTAKQFMREAAQKAGCITSKDSRKLILALEPEVASIYVRNLTIGVQLDHGIDRNIKFLDGTRYIIVDAGGGTTDVTCHEVCHEQRCVKELCAASGGGWGSVAVDDNFVSLLAKVFGGDFIISFKKEHTEQWLSVMNHFEREKKAYKDQKGMRIDLSYQLAKSYNRKTGNDIENINKFGVTFDNGFIVISHDTVLSLFKPVISKIVDHIHKLLSCPDLSSMSYLLLVGGFGQCPILQKELQENFSGMKAIFPNEAQLAVIRGAVSFGHNTDTITCRIAQHTYGVAIEPKFDAKIHNKEKKVTYEGNSTQYCEDVFQPFVQKGNKLEKGLIITIPFFPRQTGQTQMSFDIYCTEETSLAEVEYVTDEKFRRIGGLLVDMPDQRGDLYRIVNVYFLFGGTEIKVLAKDVNSGKTTKAYIEMILP